MLIKNELSQYNSAKSPWIRHYDNGKTDIGYEFGSNNPTKISLSAYGSLNFILNWIKTTNINYYEYEAILLCLKEKENKLSVVR